MKNFSLPVLFYSNLHACDIPIDAFLAKLSDTRREIVQRRPKKDQLASACAELLLRRGLTLCGYSDTEPAAIDWNGKPHFVPFSQNLPVVFSITHTAHTVAVLLSGAENPCGVDAEEIRNLRNMEAIAKKMFTAEELAWFDAQGRTTHAFFALWTAKEAFIKYTGEGFSRALQTVQTAMSIQTDPHTQMRRAQTVDNTVSCFLRHFEVGSVIFCAALQHAAPLDMYQIPLQDLQ